MATLILLNHVHKFVREQSLPLLGLRQIAARREYQIVSDGVRQGIHRARRLGSASITMDAHPAKVVAEARLEISSAVGIKRPPSRTQHFVYDRRCITNSLARSSRC